MSKKKIKKRFSLKERVNYHGKRISSSKSTVKQRNFSEGYVDAVNCDYSKIHKDKFRTESEKKIYLSGFDKGNRALVYSHEIKF